MSENYISDMVIACSEALKIGDDVPSDHPMRHQVRTMKNNAIEAIQTASRTVFNLSSQAKLLVKDFDGAMSKSAQEGGK